MTNFILGMLLMWFILSFAIVLGEEFFGQKVKWNDWFAFVICCPVALINSIINFVFKTIKHIRKK